MSMKHLNLLLFASSMMFVAPAYGQDYKQVWADEFNNVGSVDERTWNYEIGNRDNGFGNWELESYQKANATVGLAPDGTTKALIITAKPDRTWHDSSPRTRCRSNMVSWKHAS